ncbi:hypothetical protein GJAV_G00269770 [Gymnothorax javanicus]|nr:hypothetical protein GJAV_G00269770 [Gymnothorax javanicus]
MKMMESLVIKLICSNNGAMDYGDLVDFGSGLLNVKGVIDAVTGNDHFSVVTLNGKKRVVAKTKVRLCKARECTDCRNLHLCKFFLYGDCRNGRSRRGCHFCHDMTSEHNASVLRENNLQHLDRTELCTLLLQNDNTLLPPVCFSYNKGNGEYGNCPDQGSCRRLHICDRYLDGACPSGDGLSQNIQALKKGDGRNANTGGPAREKTEICPYFVKGSCKQGDKCWKEHSKMPYKWEIRSGNGWSALLDNEEIEKDFCNPANVYSRGSPPVHFDTMTRDEYDNWIQYASVEGQHRLASITSEDLERQYLEDSSAVMEFTAGAQSYKLSLQDMIQTNERYGTKRLVRRRPVFVSAADAEKAKTSKTRPGNNFKAVPAYWDKSMLTDTGYKKISLQESSDEYQKILNLFQKTMRGYGVYSVERVQNRSLWEVFQWQKDLMRKNNSGKNVGDRLLFHGTDSAHVEAICQQNFDWRLCGTHGTAYGKGSYFARDANYSHCYTGSSGMRTMFVCRVLVGCYTKGDPSYLRPPSKDVTVTSFRRSVRSSAIYSDPKASPGSTPSQCYFCEASTGRSPSQCYS